MSSMERPLEVVVVGGSIAGLAVAHGLLHALPGCKVTVLERARHLTEGGAGLGLDRETCTALADWGLGKGLQEASLPLDTEVNRAVNEKTKTAREIYRDDKYDHRSCHWALLHHVLSAALPEGILHLGHTMTSFENIEGGRRVRVHVAGREEPFEGDLMVAADGTMSQTREKPVGDQRRYAGYVAWRSVIPANEHPDVSSVEWQLSCTQSGRTKQSCHPSLTRQLHYEYPGLGHTLYFDLAHNTHSVLYEVPCHRLNWLWYVNQPEPRLKAHSLTVQPEPEVVERMREEAAKTWPPALAALMQTTEQPFINAIFDRDPISRWVYGRVVLLGEAAHPVTPHGLRSTNMSILDAHTLAQCLREHLAGGGSVADLAPALDRFQKARIPVTTQEVLFSRYLGQLKQGLVHVPGVSDWYDVDENQAAVLGQKHMHHQPHGLNPEARQQAGAQRGQAWPALR